MHYCKQSHFSVFLLILYTTLYGCHAESPKTPGQKNQNQAVTQRMNEKEKFLWLQERTGQRAQSWVRKQNQRTLGALQKNPLYEQLKNKLLSDYNDPQKLIRGQRMSGYVYDFHQNAQHTRGVWRRVPEQDFDNASNPNKLSWEIVFDLDQVAKQENRDWVFEEVSCLQPSPKRCLIHLSDGGRDATLIREFDLVDKA
ncbi:MAG: hypothetical protein AAGJ35_13215, partial [Myxococcota bacterium]